MYTTGGSILPDTFQDYKQGGVLHSRDALDEFVFGSWLISALELQVASFAGFEWVDPVLPAKDHWR